MVMTATVFAVFTGFAFVIPFLPLYVRQLGVEDERAVALWAGVLIGIAPLLAGLLAPLWGRLGDRHGNKRVALAALAAYVVVLAATAGVRSVGELLVARIAIGLFGGIGPLSLAMATTQARREQTGRAVGMVQAAQILAAAVGPLAGGLLADTIGIRATFFVTAAICAGSWLLVARGYTEAPRDQPSNTSPARGSLRSLLAVPRMISMLVVVFLVNFVGRSFTPILPLYLQDLGVAAGRLALHTGMLVSAYAVAAAVSAAGFGRATRNHAPRLLLTASLVGGALAVFPMSLVSSFTQILILAALLGLLSGGGLTLCYTIGGLLAPQEQRATAFGFLAGSALFGGAISPTVAGLLAQWDLRGIFVLDAALLAGLAAGQLAAWRADRASAGPRQVAG
jgi:DHA1 family multidrug resistance protein-like MFS transporter